MKKKIVRDIVRQEVPRSPALLTSATLRMIRDEAARQHFNIGQTIAELDALSNEINATLAFLKARRGDKN